MSDLRFACIRLPSFALRHFVHRQEEIHHAGLYVCHDKRRIVLQENVLMAQACVRSTPSRRSVNDILISPL